MHKADKRTIQEYRNKFRLFDTAPHLEENRANSESLSNEIKTRNKLWHEFLTLDVLGRSSLKCTTPVLSFAYTIAVLLDLSSTAGNKLKGLFS